MDIRRLVHRIAAILGPDAPPARIEAVAAAVLDVVAPEVHASPPAPGPGPAPFGIQSVTLGISLLDCSSPLPQTVRARVYDKIRRVAAHHVSIAHDVAARAGVDIEQAPVAVTPLALVASSMARDELIGLAQLLDTAADHVGTAYLCGFSAHAHHGISTSARQLIDALPAALVTTQRLCGSMTCGTTETGLNLDAVRQAAEIISETTRLARDGSLATARFAALCHASPPMAFPPGAFHDPAIPDAAITVGLSGVEAICYGLRSVEAGAPINQMCTAITKATSTLIRAGAHIGRACADALNQRTGPPVAFGGVSLSLSPASREHDILDRLLTTLDAETAGSAGTTALLTLLVEAVRKGARLVNERTGVVRGACLPLPYSASQGLAHRHAAFSATVGLDLVPLPGTTSTEMLAGLLFDAFTTKPLPLTTTACRLAPILGKQPGDLVSANATGALPVASPFSSSSSWILQQSGHVALGV